MHFLIIFLIDIEQIFVFCEFLDHMIAISNFNSLFYLKTVVIGNIFFDNTQTGLVSLVELLNIQKEIPIII